MRNIVWQFWRARFAMATKWGESVPVAQIGCSGVTGLVRSANETRNRKPALVLVELE